MSGQQRSQGIAADYVDVSERIVEFRAKHPDGCLRPADLSKPYDVVTIGDTTWIVVVAAAFRTPDDPCPGVGMAWEEFPGRTNFTRTSELQNAETSAWGRALIAVGAADAKRGISSKQEVEHRRDAVPAPSAPQTHTQPPPSAPTPQTAAESVPQRRTAAEVVAAEGHPLLMALAKVPESRKEEAHRFLAAAANGVEWEDLPAAKVRALAKQVESMAAEAAA